MGTTNALFSVGDLCQIAKTTVRLANLTTAQSDLGVEVLDFSDLVSEPKTLDSFLTEILQEKNTVQAFANPVTAIEKDTSTTKMTFVAGKLLAAIALLECVDLALARQLKGTDAATAVKRSIADALQEGKTSNEASNFVTIGKIEGASARKLMQELNRELQEEEE